jgi:biopolymer transport protein ExbB
MFSRHSTTRYPLRNGVKPNFTDVLARLSSIYILAFCLIAGISLSASADEGAVASASAQPTELSAAVPPAVVDSTKTHAAARALTVMRQGGPMMIPLAISSFVLFLFIFERAISLRAGRVIPRPFVRKFLEQVQSGTLEPREALELCEENRSPIAEVFAACVKKWDRPSVEVEQAIIDSGERVAANLRKYLRLFNGIATTSPLFGLLGTVTGMIQAFNVIANADAMGRPEMLAGGIGEALITTAAGLTIAIPATIAYMYFTGRVDRLVGEIDEYGQELVGEIASDGWKQRSSKRGAKTKAAAA